MRCKTCNKVMTPPRTHRKKTYCNAACYEKDPEKPNSNGTSPRSNQSLYRERQDLLGRAWA